MKIITNQSGMTVVELLITMVVFSLILATITDFAFNFWRYSFVVNDYEASLSQRLNTQDILRESIGSAVKMINQNSLPDSNTNAPDTSIGSGQYWKVIHTIPGNQLLASDGSAVPLLYYSRYSTNASRNYIMNGVIPYEDEFVIYIDSAQKQLLIRTIANSNAIGNALLSTCPPAIATSSCPSDKVLADDVTSVGLKYFSHAGNTMDWTSVVDATSGAYIGPDFPLVEVVEITLNVSRKVQFANPSITKNTTITRISLRNY